MVGPNSKWVLMAEPPGLTEPSRVASVLPMSVGASVDTSIGAYACAKSYCAPAPPAV